MTLTPRTIRLDLKCGKGAISQGEKCTKGPAREAIEKAAPVALGLGLAAGLIALRRRGKKPRIGDGGTVPNIPKNPPKPPPNSSNPARTAEMVARAKAATQRGIERTRRRVRENPQEVAWEMQADRIKKSAIRDVTRSKKFNDAFNINIPDSAARKITDRTNPSRITSAGEMVYSWLENTGISAKEAETLVRKKGKILDIYGIPDLDVDTASNDLVKGGNSVNSEAVQKVRAAIEKFYRSDSTDDALSRLDLKCGKGAISEGEKCTKGPATKAAIAAGIGLTAGAVALGAVAMSKRGRSRPSGATSPNPSSPSPQPRLPGSSPRALLKAAPPRQSKTQRMRANTAAAVKNAEGRIAQTAREEVRRIGQIGNTMAAAGEATGMAAKTTLRELRLRTEAARRRFEPGYRAPDQRRLPQGTQPKLTAGDLTPQREAIPIDPRTGQPRRRKARGFGRTDNFIQHYASVQLQPPTRRS